MPNVTISELRQAGPITGAELVPVVQNGVTVQTTTRALAGAPLQSQTFLTLNQEATLPNSRYLSVGTGLGLTDGGAQSTYQIALTGAGLSLVTSPNGLQVKTGPNTVGAVQIAVGNGLSITNANGATGNPTISLATGIMSNLAATTGTGFLAVNGATVTPVSLQPVANQTVVYDPSAVAGVPAVGLADNPVVPGTASITVPTGTTAQRAATPATAMFRFNITTGFFEGYDGVTWRPFSVGGAAVTSFSAGTTGLTPNTASTGVVTLGGVLNAASGGTGAASLTGYLYGNGTSPATASTTIPTTNLSGQITNAQLVNPSLTINGSLVNLGSSTTVTAATPNALTAGTGLSGGSFTGASAATFALANTTVTAGSYGSAANTTPFTVDAQGRLTAAASTPIAILSQQITDKGAANGVASLDATGVVPLAQLPASIAGAVSYQGGWNASTNTPTLSSGIGTKGYYYIVTTAGTTTLNGINLWSVGDWAVFDGTAWEKVNGSSSEAFSNITLTALTGLLYGNSTSPLTVATGAQVLSGLSTALGTGVATSLGQIVNTANGFVTQSGADGRYAALAGLSTQVFNVANATTSTEAVSLGQAQSDFAPISGSAVYVSSAALAASGGAALVGYSQGASGSVLRTQASKNQESVSVLDFGADPTGVTDSTAAFDAAGAASTEVRVPPTSQSFLLGGTVTSGTARWLIDAELTGPGGLPGTSGYPSAQEFQSIPTPSGAMQPQALRRIVVEGKGDNATFIGANALYLEARDRTDVTTTNKGVLYGLSIGVVPAVARNNVPYDDCDGLAIMNRTGTAGAKATDAIYIAHNSSAFPSTSEWYSGLTIDANVDVGFALGGIVASYGIDLQKASFLTSVAIRLPNATSIYARNNVNTGDVPVVGLDSNNVINLGGPNVSGTSVKNWFGTPAPSGVSAVTYTVGLNDTDLIFNNSGCTVTLPAPGSFPGRILTLRTTVAFTVVSASANVFPLAGGSVGTAILAGTAGKWATLKSDGAYWQIMAGN